MEYYPLPRYNQISKFNYDFSEFQSDVIDNIVYYSHSMIKERNIPEEIKYSMRNVSLFVIQYFINKYTKKNSNNVVLYIINENKELRCI